MARPRKYYVVWLMGAVAGIFHGRDAALSVSQSFKGFRTQLEAEEFAAWWEYQHARH